MNEKTETRPAESRNIYRFGAFVLAVVVGVTSLSARMFYLQVVKGQQADQGANVALTATQSVASTRGLMYDASGAPLVKNVVTYSVTVTPIDLNLSQKPLVAERLGSLLSTNPVDIETRIDSATGSLYEPVKIADNVPVEVARFIEENSDSLPGVKVVVIQHRQYVTGPLFSELIGYTGQITQAQYDNLKGQGYSTSDVVGQNGLEASYEQLLRGTYGDESVALDDSGKAIPGLVTGHNLPVPGESLTLTIDTHEQQIAQKALQWGLNGSSVPIATRGVIIVENPQNGNILAMVSLPSYDDQKFADGIGEADFQKLLTDPSQPLLNKAIADQYAPGSTFKLVTGTAGLQDNPPCSFAGDKTRDSFDYCSGSFDGSTTLLSQPYIQIGAFKFWEWDKQGWGPLNITQGVAYSSDTFFYQLAQMVGLDRLTFWATQYGFGAPTGIDLPFEASGIVPTNDWKEKNTGLPMYTGEILQAGIGQGYDAATPLQLLNAYCALANGGNLWQPHVVQSTTDSDDNVTPDTGEASEQAAGLAGDSSGHAPGDAGRGHHSTHIQPRGPADQGRGQDRDRGVRRQRQVRAPAIPRVVRRLRAGRSLQRRLHEAGLAASRGGLHLRRGYLGQRGHGGRQVLPDDALRLEGRSLQYPHSWVHPNLDSASDQLLRQSEQGLTVSTDP